MTQIIMNTIDQQVTDTISEVKIDEWSRQYWAQGEFLALERLFPQSFIERLMVEVEDVRPQINRNFIPKHKKGGSVSYYLLQEKAPAMLELYQHQGLIDVLSQLAGVPLLLCPDEDPHACALYFYTEAGDHIGYHYDTSYYKGARYTVLIGLRDQSSSQLLCRLHTKDADREVQELALATDPGTFIFFNGDKLHHAVSPMAESEERIVLTLQYVTDPAMSFTHRWFSNMKDAVGYFGWSAVFRRPTRK